MNPCATLVKQTAVDAIINTDSRVMAVTVPSSFFGHTDKSVFSSREMKHTIAAKVHIPIIVTIFISNGSE